MRRCHILQLLLYFTGSITVQTRVLTRWSSNCFVEKCVHTFAVQLFRKSKRRSKGNWFKTCAPREQETSQTCQQKALRSQATERGVTIAHTEPSFRGEVAPQLSPMQHNSEVCSGIFKLHRVERMRHMNQVGMKSTWSSPESTRSARWIVHSRGPRPACGSGFLWRRSASTSGGVCNSWRTGMRRHWNRRPCTARRFRSSGRKCRRRAIRTQSDVC